MSTAVAPRLSVCPEYQQLLDSCQKSLAIWQQRIHAERGLLFSAEARSELKRLQEKYKRACAQLEKHEQFCQTCQYIAKVGGLDFESLTSALGRRENFS